MSYAANESFQEGPLPALFRIAAGARHVLGDSGARLLYRSPLAPLLRRALSVSAPAGVSRVTVCGGALRGCQLLVDLSREKYYWLGAHEAAVQELMIREVRPGAVVYDIGAHIGFFTLLFARLVGDGGHVYAFEPQAQNFARLLKNLELNRVRTVEALQVALRDRDGWAVFLSHGSTLEGHLLDGCDVDHTGGVQVRMQTVDGIVSDGGAPPDLIKIDVEGAEGAVLRGAVATIRAYRPRLIIEVHSPEAGEEVLRALPVPYLFRDVRTGRVATSRLSGGHYFAERREG